MKTYSLRTRVIGAIAATLVIFLGGTGAALQSAFIESIEKSIASSQASQIYALLAQIDDEDPKALTLPEYLADDSFNQISSGLYGFLLDKDKQVRWRSASVTSQNWIPIEVYANGKMLFNTPSETQPYYSTSFGLIWEDNEDSSKTHSYVLQVAEEKTRYIEVMSAFRHHLWGWFAAIIFLLLLVLSFVLVWSFRPLRQVADEIHSIEGGLVDKIVGDFPVEIKRLTDNINTLLSSERNQRQRYRDSLADLAHSLKTPLAVLKSLSLEHLQPKELEQHVYEQVDRMDQIVGHQLQRAVTSSKAAFQKPIEVKPIIAKIRSALEKVYRDRNVEISILGSDKACFFGDEGDLMEIMGNIMENAAKYSHGKVACEIQERTRSNGKPGVTIFVDDNGPGIPDENRESVLRRGGRVDERIEGQGIGLAVASEIIDSYGGQIRIESSSLGGARFMLLL